MLYILYYKDSKIIMFHKYSLWISVLEIERTYIYSPYLHNV